MRCSQPPSGASRHRSIVSSSIEHSSILAPLADLEARGFTVVRTAPDREGRLSPDEIAAAVNADTALVSMALANSEVGTIQDVNAIADTPRRRGRPPKNPAS